MKKINTLILTLLLSVSFAVPSSAAVFGEKPSVTIDGRKITDLTNLKVLICSTATSATSCTLDGSTTYDVPNSLTFRIIGAKCTLIGTAQGQASIGFHSAALLDAAPAGTSLTGQRTIGDARNAIIACQPTAQGPGWSEHYFGEDGPTVTGTAGVEILWIDGTQASNHNMLIFGYEE